MELSRKDTLRLDLMNSLAALGGLEVVRILSASMREAQVPQKTPELQLLAAALSDLAEKTERLKQTYGE